MKEQREIPTFDIYKAELNIRFENLGKNIAQALRNPSRYATQVMQGLVAITTVGIPTAALIYETYQVASPQIVNADGCPPSPTDGKPAPFCLVPSGTDLQAASKFSRYYFINKDNDPRYTPEDTDVMGVPNAQLAVESIESEGSSDFLNLDLHSRKVENGRVSYFDRQSGKRRFVGHLDVMKVPTDGGTGLALTANNSDTRVWQLTPGQIADKVWGPIATEARANKHQCSPDKPCGWNCVEWVVVNRLKAGANTNGLSAIPNDLIHVEINPITREPVINPSTGQTKISAIVDYVYFYDRMQGEQVVRDHSYINTVVEEGDPIWVKEGLTYKQVERPFRIVPYNNN